MFGEVRSKIHIQVSCIFGVLEKLIVAYLVKKFLAF
jgi:hypothetical protein